MGCQDMHATILVHLAISIAKQMYFKYPSLVEQYEIISCKAEIGHAPFHMYFAYQVPGTSPYIKAIPTTAVDITITIKLDSIRDASVIGGKQPTICQKSASAALYNIKSIDGMRLSRVNFLQKSVNNYQSLAKMTSLPELM